MLHNVALVPSHFPHCQVKSNGDGWVRARNISNSGTAVFFPLTATHCHFVRSLIERAEGSHSSFVLESLTVTSGGTVRQDSAALGPSG